MEDSLSISADANGLASVGNMLTSEQLDHLFGNSTSNASYEIEKAVSTDFCGRPRDLSFAPSGQHDWIWLTRISFPVFLVTGTFGNVLGIVTVYGDSKGPKRTFLLGMFIADLWFLWNRLAVYLGSRMWGSEANTTDLYGTFYKATAGLWLYLESVLFFCSQWILLAFCIDRFLAIELPVHHYTAKRRHSFRALAFIFAASSVNSLYIPLVYYWLLQNTNLAAGQVIPEFPAVFRRWRRIEMWWEVVDRLFAYCSIAVLNYMIISRLRKTANPGYNVSVSPKNPVHLLPSRPPLAGAKGHQKVARTTSRAAANKILISSSFFFLITQSLDFTMSLLVAFSQPPICLFHITNSFLHVYDPFRNFLVNMNSALGFMFYLCFGANFRGRLRSSLCIPSQP